MKLKHQEVLAGRPYKKLLHTDLYMQIKKVKFSHTRYRALGPELLLVYRQSDRR